MPSSECRRPTACFRKKDADGEIAAGGHIQFHRIAEHEARSRESIPTCRPLKVRARSEPLTIPDPFARRRNMCGADIHGLLSVSIREADPHGIAADTGVDDLAQRLIFELQFGGAHLRVIGELRRRAGAPGGDPVILGRAENC